MMEIGLVIQARIGSTRLPGKVLKNLSGKPLLLHVIDRLREIRGGYLILVVITNLKEDDKILEFCQKQKISCYRGSELDVLDRYYMAAKFHKIKHIVRLTGDNPLLDVENLKFLISEHLSKNADYSSNKSEVESGLPDGVGAEIFTFSALEKSWMNGKEANHREHVNEYILENRGEFKLLCVKAVEDVPPICGNLRLTVDTLADFKFVESILDLLKAKKREVNLTNICRLKNENLI